MKIASRKQNICLLLLFLMTAWMSLTAMAAENRLSVIVGRDKGKAISGMSVALYELAEEQEDTEGFSVKELYQELLSEEKLRGLKTMTGDEIHQLTEELRTRARSGLDQPVESVLTDGEGGAVFTKELKNGIYLVDFLETGNVKTSASLVTFPLLETTEDGMVKISTEVTVTAKVEENSTPSDRPNRPSGGGGGSTPPGPIRSVTPKAPEVAGVERILEQVQKVLGVDRAVATSDNSHAELAFLIMMVNAVGLVLSRRRKR